jgi:hypothetical protein
VIKKIIRINYYKRLSSFIASYKVRVVAYCFNSIKILTKYTNLGTITTTNKELYNFTAISVNITIDLNIKA